MAIRFYVSTANAPFFVDNVMGYGDSIPVSGAHKVGDFIISSTQADGVFGWVCTVAGTPGEWSEIGSGGSGGGAGKAMTLEAMENVVDVRTTNKVLIGINEYDPSTDILEVHYNGTKLSEGVHFTLNKTEKSINKISGTWNPENLPDYKMDFRVIKATVGMGTLEKITKSVTFSEPRTEVTMGIPEFVYGSDVLDVHLNGIKLMEGIDFNYVAGDNKIVKIDTSEPWNMYSVNNQIMIFDVIKNTANIDLSGTQLVDGSILMSKLSPEVRELINSSNLLIGDLNKLTTNNKTDLVSAINEIKAELGNTNLKIYSEVNKLMRY